MNKLTIMGLGPGSKKFITLDVYNKLIASEKVYLRTAKHPIVDELKKYTEFESFDDYYENYDTFEEVYQNISKEILKKLQTEDVVYAVPGNPFVAEKTVEYLIAEVENIEILHGSSFIDAIISSLKVDPVDGFSIIDGMTIEEAKIDITIDNLIIQVYNERVASDVKLKLMEYYPDDTDIIIVKAAGVDNLEEIIEAKLYELDRYELDHLTSIYIKKIKDNREFFYLEDLVDVVRILRSPSGCPWDKKQTHQTLTKNLIEESYEVVDAINEDDLFALEEALGDLLLQVVFHASIASDNGYFNINDVIAGIHNKMIRRHPHVFGDIDASDVDEVKKNWEEIKSKEKNNPTLIEELDSIPNSFPPLLKLEKFQKKLLKYGKISSDIDKVINEIKDLLHKFSDDLNKNTLNDVLVDLLFLIIHLSIITKIDVFTLLDDRIRKQKSRYIE